MPNKQKSSGSGRQLVKMPPTSKKFELHIAFGLFVYEFIGSLVML